MLILPINSSDTYEALGLKGTTIPKSMEGTFEVEIRSRGCWYSPYTGKLIVKKATGAYAKHRIFIPCKCGREIPSGRVSQHRCPYSAHKGRPMRPGHYITYTSNRNHPFVVVYVDAAGRTWEWGHDAYVLTDVKIHAHKAIKGNEYEMPVWVPVRRDYGLDWSIMGASESHLESLLADSSINDPGFNSTNPVVQHVQIMWRFSLELPEECHASAL